MSLTFGAFSAGREAFGTRILRSFGNQWLKTHKQEAAFEELYEGSEKLTKSIATDFEADVAVFALTQDLENLVRKGLVDPGWRNSPYQGIVSRSLVVFAVRKGNPKQILDWSDLARPGIRIVTPDPETSGGGKWNACAIYGAALRGHADVSAGDPQAASEFLARVLVNVVERKKNAGESFRCFQEGTGDVAIAYENEVRTGWMFGYDDQRVIPSSTVLVENPGALITKYVDKHGSRDVAEALLQYLWTPEAQKRLAFCGLRPVNPAVAIDTAQQFPNPADLWTIEDLGGWERAYREILVPAGLLHPSAVPGK